MATFSSSCAAERPTNDYQVAQNAVQQPLLNVWQPANNLSREEQLQRLALHSSYQTERLQRSQPHNPYREERFQRSQPHNPYKAEGLHIAKPHNPYKAEGLHIAKPHNPYKEERLYMEEPHLYKKEPLQRLQQHSPSVGEQLSSLAPYKLSRNQLPCMVYLYSVNSAQKDPAGGWDANHVFELLSNDSHGDESPAEKSSNERRASDQPASQKPKRKRDSSDDPADEEPTNNEDNEDDPSDPDDEPTNNEDNEDDPSDPDDEPTNNEDNQDDISDPDDEEPYNENNNDDDDTGNIEAMLLILLMALLGIAGELRTDNKAEEEEEEEKKEKIKQEAKVIDIEGGRGRGRKPGATPRPKNAKGKKLFSFFRNMHISKKKFSEHKTKAQARRRERIKLEKALAKQAKEEQAKMQQTTAASQQEQAAKKTTSYNSGQKLLHLLQSAVKKVVSYLLRAIGKNGNMQKSKTITFFYSPAYTKIRKAKGATSFTIAVERDIEAWDSFSTAPIKQGRKAPLSSLDKATEAKVKLRLFF